MKVPQGLLDPRGRAAKGSVALLINGHPAPEYGIVAKDSNTTCYIFAAPGDVVSITLAINSGITAEFADLVVDGILRNTWPNTRGAKVLRNHFDRAVYRGAQIGETKKRKTMACMKIVDRVPMEDVDTSADDVASKVGSIEVQIFRKLASQDTAAGPSQAQSDQDVCDDTSGDINGGDRNAKGSQCLGVCERAPSFDKFRTWSDLEISKNTPAFAIGFFDGNKHFQWPTKRIKEEFTGDFKLWASFTFLLRSKAELEALGFENLPDHHPPSEIASDGDDEETVQDCDVPPTSIQAEKLEFAHESGSSEGDTQLAKSISNSVIAASKKAVENSKTAPPPARQVTPSGAENTANTIVKDAKQLKRFNDIAIVDIAFAETVAESLVGLPTTNSLPEGKEAIPVAPMAPLKLRDTTKDRDGEDATSNTIDVKINEPQYQPKIQSIPLNKVPETKQELVARKKAELILKGVEGGIAHQAYLEREPTVDPDMRNDDMEVEDDTELNFMTKSLPEGKADIHKIQNLCPQRSPNDVLGRSLPSSVDLVRTSSTFVNDDKAPNIIASTHNRAVPTQGICSTAPPTASTALTMCNTSQEECPSSFATVLETRPSAPLSRRAQTCSASRFSKGSASLPSTSPLLPIENQLICSPDVIRQDPSGVSKSLFSPSLSWTPEMNVRILSSQVPSGFDSGVKNELDNPTSTIPPSVAPPDTQTGVSTQSGSQDVEMQGVADPSTPVQPCKKSIFQNKLGIVDTALSGTTTLSLQIPSFIHSDFPTETTTQTHQELRFSSPSPIEAVTEPVTEVAGQTDLEISHQSSEKQDIAFIRNNLSTSPISRTRTSIRALRRHPTSPNPSTLYSQRFKAGHSIVSKSPEPTQQGHYNCDTSSIAQNWGLPSANLYDNNQASVLSPIIHNAPMSPPKSVQKRKANFASSSELSADAETIEIDQPKVIYACNPTHFPAFNNLDRAKDLQGRIFHVEGERAEDAQPRLIASSRVKAKAHWDEMALEAEIVQARKAVAEGQRKELLARHVAALEVYKQRKRIIEMKREVEMIEHGNAELEATIDALNRGDDVASRAMYLSARTFGPTTRK